MLDQLLTSWNNDGMGILVSPHLQGADLDEAARTIELYEHYVHPLDDAQKLSVVLATARNGAGRWLAETVCRSMARQNGKGDEAEAIELAGLVFDGTPIVHTAHEIPTATRAHERMVAAFESHGDLRRRVAKVKYGNGDKIIRLHNDGEIIYRTRTVGGGRGLDDIGKLIVDEAQHCDVEHLASLTPVLAANPNPQMLVYGTAGVGAKSRWWWEQRKRALRGDTDGFAWYEHTAEEVELSENGHAESTTPDVSDIEICKKVNPAFRAGRISESFLVQQRRRFGDELFAREHLNVWDPLPLERTQSRIAEADWLAAVDVSSQIVGSVVVAVDTGFSQDRAALSVCGRNTDGVRQIEVIDFQDGTAWIESRLVAALSRSNDITTIAVDSAGPAKALVPMLQRVADERSVKLVKISAGQYSAACSSFAAALPGGLVHRGDARLSTVALTTGARRYGTEDGWMWDRRATSVEPLVAATVAFSVADGLPSKRKGSAYDHGGLLTI